MGMIKVISNNLAQYLLQGYTCDCIIKSPPPDKLVDQLPDLPVFWSTGQKFRLRVARCEHFTPLYHFAPLIPFLSPLLFKM